MTADTREWHVYEDARAGFAVSYPPGWVFDDERFDGASESDGAWRETVVFAPPELHDWLFVVSSRSAGESWASDVIARKAKSFGRDHQQLRETVVVDGIEGERTVILGCGTSGLYSEYVELEHGGRSYLITNGGSRDTAFEAFLGSFEIIR